MYVQLKLYLRIFFSHHCHQQLRQKYNRINTVFQLTTTLFNPPSRLDHDSTYMRMRRPLGARQAIAGQQRLRPRAQASGRAMMTGQAVQQRVSSPRCVFFSFSLSFLYINIQTHLPVNGRASTTRRWKGLRLKMRRIEHLVSLFFLFIFY